jgi:hypothetical protein
LLTTTLSDTKGAQILEYENILDILSPPFSMRQ